jgi:hypothetical protein
VKITITKFAKQTKRKEQLGSGKSGRKVIMKAEVWEGIGFQSNHPKIP